MVRYVTVFGQAHPLMTLSNSQGWVVDNTPIQSRVAEIEAFLIITLVHEIGHRIVWWLSNGRIEDGPTLAEQGEVVEEAIFGHVFFAWNRVTPQAQPVANPQWRFLDIGYEDGWNIPS